MVNGEDSEMQRMRRLVRSVRYRGIDPTNEYDRDEFVEAHSEHSDLEQYAAAVNKDPFDLGARRDLSGILFGNKDAHIGLSPEVMKQVAKDFRDASREAIGRYVERNFDYMFDNLDPEALKGLLLSLPLYKTGEDREHDDLVDALHEVRQLGEMLEKKDTGAVRTYVLESLKNEDLPDPIKGAVAHLVKIDEGLAYHVFNTKYAALNAIVSQALFDENGNINERKARKLFKDSLDRAKEAYDDETVEGKRSDIWKDVIRPDHLGLAKAFYPSERKEYDDDRPDEIKEMDERELERSGLRMAA